MIDTYLLIKLSDELKQFRKEVRKGFKMIRTALQTYVDVVTANYAKINSNLDNINGDTTNLLQQIVDLKALMSELSPEEQAALDALVVSATALSDRTQVAADSVPDLPTPPAG